MDRRTELTSNPGAGEAVFMAWLALASLATAAVMAVAWPVRPMVLGLVSGALLAAAWAVALRLGYLARART